MKTMYIGLDGFGEIETLKTTKKVKKHYVKKSVRFVKRSSKALANAFKNFRLPQKTESVRTPMLDACYKNARTGKNEFAVPMFHFSHRNKKQNKKKVYTVSYTRNRQSVSGGFLKRKAALGTMTACMSAVFASLAVFSTVGVSADAGNTARGDVFASASALSQRQNTEGMTSVSAEESAQNLSIYSDIARAVSQDNLTVHCAGLYMDGEFIGAVTDEYALYESFEDILAQSKETYENVVSVKYANDIEVKMGDFKSETVKAADELLKTVSDKLMIQIEVLETQEETLSYETVIEEDDSKDSSYEEVKTKGENGVEKVTYTITYVNGEQKDSVESGRETVKAPVNEVLVKGTKITQASSEGSGAFIWPVPSTHNITSGYGARWGTFHSGIDISGGNCYGADIVASDAGTVTWAGYDDSGYGNYVIIDHGNGYATLYGHCSEVYVSTGQTVAQGETVAAIGSTGYSTGPHLHFEVRSGSERLDPSNFVS